MEGVKLFMLLLGCKPAGRHTEQHDIFFCVGNSLKEIVPDIINFWPNAGTIHIDAWREVTEVDGFEIKIKLEKEQVPGKDRLFFLNLGGYKPGEFEEYHYKMLVVANEKSEAIRRSKETAFYKHAGFKGAESHIDDKYGIDVDDLYQIEDILPEHNKRKYALEIIPGNNLQKDEWQIGYTVLSKLT